MLSLNGPSIGSDDNGSGVYRAEELNDESEHSSALLPPRSLLESNIPRVACALLAALTTGGVSYAFGLYGNALKKTLHLSQAQLETISSATFVAGLFSWIPGIFVDRFGTRYGISLGGVLGAAALMLYWAVAKQYIHISSLSLVVAILSALGVILFLACALVTGSVFKVISCNCGTGSKGRAVGIAKGYVGLGSGVYACLFEALRSESNSDLDFLPMCAFFLIVVASIPSFFVLPTKTHEEFVVNDDFTSLHFRILYGSLAVLATVIVGKSLMDLTDSRTSHNAHLEPNYSIAALILALWWFPIAAQTFLPPHTQITLPDVMDAERSSLLDDGILTPSTSGEAAEAEPTLNRIPSSNQVVDDDNQTADHNSRTTQTRAHEEINLFQMLQSSSAWLMLWTATILVGGGIVETNNLGQMVEALQFPPAVTPASLSLFSVAQSAGRVAAGSISEAALHWNTKRCCLDKGVPRPFFLAVASVTAVLAHSLLAISTDEVFFVVGIALSGLAFGMVWPLMVLIVGEIYGTSHFSANYMFCDGFTSAAGTVLLSKIVAQRVYDSHIEGHHTDDGVTCYGEACFQLTHVVVTVLSVSGALASLRMQHVTRELYNKSSHLH